jgi:hypothetical protein
MSGGDEDSAKSWLAGLGGAPSVGGVLIAVSVAAVAALGAFAYSTVGNGRENNYRDMSDHYAREFRGKTVIVTGANTGVG